MKWILNLGSINIDNIYRVPYFVRPGETLSSKAFTRGAGGKGFNQSIALARAGANVSHVGRYGADAEWLRDRLAAEKVDVGQLLPVDMPTGHAIIQVDDEGQNAIVLHAGANHALTPSEVPSLFATAQTGDWFLTQNETSCVPESLKLAHSLNLTVCFNPAPMSPAVTDYPLETVDWLILNETEGEALSGESVPNNILNKLRQRCPRAHLVLTLGAEGALCLTPDGKRVRSLSPRVTPIDTTAAGDGFIGYLIAAAMQGKDLSSALALVCKAAAISVTRPGAADSIPHFPEI